MESQHKPSEDPLDQLPDELHQTVRHAAGNEKIWATASFDLDEHGKYVEAYLVLTDHRLAEYVASNGQWQSRWLNVSSYSESRIVEGLGMGLLRLLTDGKRAEEFRFTMRHAKTVARLQRQLERQIEGEEGQAEPIEEIR